MEDALRVRTERLLTDYLEYCAREPGTIGRPPSTPEAAVLRCLAVLVRERFPGVWSDYRGYQGNRLELVRWVSRSVLRGRPPSWGFVVALLVFTGTLLERPTPGPTRELQPREAGVDQDCQPLVALLCDCLTVQHRAWLEARGGWDSFCYIFTPELTCWRRRLAQILLSCFTATILTYLWGKLS